MPTRHPSTAPSPVPPQAGKNDLGAANCGDLIILIGPYQFTVRASYSAGHRLTEAEASAFNEWRARGIIGNVRPLVNAAAASLPPGSLLSDEALARLQSKISEFDAGYAHPMERGTRNTVNPLPKRGAIEQMAHAIAGRALEASNRAAGIRQHQADFDRQRGELASTPEYRAQARLALRAQTLAVLSEDQE